MKKPLTTLADQWQAHADRTLEIDASHAQVIRARREWYFAQVERLAAISNRSPREEALFQEGLSFGRCIGRPIEFAA